MRENKEAYGDKIANFHKLHIGTALHNLTSNFMAKNKSSRCSGATTNHVLCFSLIRFKTENKASEYKIKCT